MVVGLAVILDMGIKRYLIAGSIVIAVLTVTLGLLSHKRLSRQEALDAAAVGQTTGRVEAKLMHFSDLAKAYSAIGQPLRPNEKPIGGGELVWVIVISGYLFSPSCGGAAGAPMATGQCEPNWTMLVVRDRRNDLPPPYNGQAWTRASIVRANYTEAWPPFFGALPDLESVPILF